MLIVGATGLLQVGDLAASMVALQGIVCATASVALVIVLKLSFRQRGSHLSFLFKLWQFCGSLIIWISES